jgi:carbonic anhydrase
MYLKVRHIIVCGHYGCGGVIASLAPQSFGVIDGWIKNIKNVADANWTQLKEMDEKARIAHLIELNTIQQAKNLIKTDTIQRAWAQGQEVYIHGWVFDLASGKLKDLISIDKNSKI